MSHLTVETLTAAAEGRCTLAHSAKASMPIERVAIDSREVERGDVFWALAGARCNGADFIEQAFERGAAGIVSNREIVQPPPGKWAIKVDDAREALVRAAQCQRAAFGGRVVGVTGSVGKTTTRQMIHAVLGGRLEGSASPRNFNNHVGLPLSMLGWRRTYQYAVVELGASAPGEIQSLAELCRPHVGVITRIGEAHLGTFGSRGALLGAKLELLESLSADGLAILPDDDRRFKHVASHCKAAIATVGRSARADFSATRVRSADGRLDFCVNGHPMAVAAWGRHHLSAALIAVAVGRHFGLDWHAIADGLANFRAATMRCEVVKTGAATIINDCYNASPAAMRAALELLRDVRTEGRRIALCGDMRELGGEASQFHRQLGRQVVDVCGADVLIACGDHADQVVRGAGEAGMPAQNVFACRSVDDATEVARRVLRPGDVLLVKGSRVLGLERCVAAIA